MPSRTALLLAPIAMTAAVAAAQPDPLRLHAERAEAFARAGELDRAASEYRREVLPRALRRLGNLDGAEGRTAEAVEALALAAELTPDDAEVLADLAVARLRARDPAGAAADAERAVAAAPRHARARSVLGRALLLHGHAERAAVELRQSLAEEPRFETAFALALASLRLERGPAARALFDRMLGTARGADTLVLVGRAYLDAGRAGDAAPYFSEALEREPGHEPAARYLRAATGGAASRAEPPGAVVLEMLPGVSSDDAGRRALLRAQLEQLLAGAWHNLAVIHTRQGQPERAADAARRSARWERRTAGAVTDAPPANTGDAGTWLALAESHVAAGDATRALEALSHLPAGTAGADAVRLHALLIAGRLDEARALLPAAAAATDARAAAALIARLDALGLRDEAERVLAAVPSGIAAAPDLQVAAARLRIGRGDAQAGERQLRDLLAAHPAFVPALHLLATLAAARGEDAEAVALLLRAREAGGDDAGLLRDLANAAARSGHLEEALAAARRLAARTPDDAGSRYLLGIVLLQNQEWQEARQVLSAAPEADTDARWAAALGLAEYGAREYDAARAAFATALRLDPAHVEARYHLGLIAREQGRTADAVDELQRVIALAPGHAAAHGELGALYLLLDRLDQARATLERAVALDPDAPAPHYQLGLLHARAGDATAARREMELFQRARAKSLAGRQPL